MSGYKRQDTPNNISDGSIINADDLDNEFDALEAAFSVTGHTHDGTVENGGAVSKVGPNQEVAVTTSGIIPKVDDASDLGSAAFEFKDLYLDGTANIDSLVADTADINAGTIDATVIGGTTPAAVSATTLSSTGNAVVGGTLSATGNVAVNTNKFTVAAATGNTVVAGTLNVTGVVTAPVTSSSATITGGTINGTTIGASTPASIAATTLTASGAATLNTLSSSGATITGGSVNATPVGASTPSTGAFTTLSATGAITFPDNSISGDKVEGGTINATTITTLASTTGNITNVNATTVDTTNIEVSALKAKDGTAAGTIANTTGVVTLGSSVLTTTDINGGTIDGTSIGASTAASGSFTTLTASGAVTVPTPTTSTHAATKGYVDTSISNLIDSAPAALDTLNELAAALGDDANFATTVTNSLALKAPIASPTFTGTTTIPTAAVTNFTASGAFSLTGDQVQVTEGGTGATTAGGARTNLGLGTIATQDSSSVSLTGGSITGITDLAIADGGTAASTANAGFNNLAPAQTGNTGKYLSTDGTDTSWAAVDALPSQTGNNGKYLTTDGSAASWGVLDTDANTTTKGLYEMANTISVDYTIGTGNNAMSTGPITVNSGVSVTVPSGSRWVVI